MRRKGDSGGAARVLRLTSRKLHRGVGTFHTTRLSQSHRPNHDPAPTLERLRASRKESLMIRLTIGVSLALVAALAGDAFAITIFSASGNDAADIQATVDTFRAALGNPNNGNGGPSATGHREINWDGGGSTDTSPGVTPFNVFRNTRGGQFITPGTGCFRARQRAERRRTRDRLQQRDVRDDLRHLQRAPAVRARREQRDRRDLLHPRHERDDPRGRAGLRRGLRGRRSGRVDTHRAVRLRRQPDRQRERAGHRRHQHPFVPRPACRPGRPADRARAPDHWHRGARPERRRQRRHRRHGRLLL